MKTVITAIQRHPLTIFFVASVGLALYLIAVSVIMTSVFNQTRGSVFVMALMHAMFDTVSIAVTTLIETSVPLLAFALGAGVAWLLVLVLIIVQGANLGGSHQPRELQKVPVITTGRR